MPYYGVQDKLEQQGLNLDLSRLNKYLKLFNVDFIAFKILASYSNDAIETAEKIRTKVDNTFNIKNLIKNKGEEKAYAIILIKQLMFDFFKKKILCDAEKNLNLADISKKIKDNDETEYLKLIETFMFNEFNIFFKLYMGEEL